jgi:hypothetical protein
VCVTCYLESIGRGAVVGWRDDERDGPKLLECLAADGDLRAFARDHALLYKGAAGLQPYGYSIAGVWLDVEGFTASANRQRETCLLTQR